MRTERSSQYQKVTRWRVRWVDDSGNEKTKVFERKPDAQTFLNGLTADIQRGEYVDPKKSGVTFGTIAEDWFTTKAHRKPKTLAGYRGLLDTLILPRWGNTPLKQVDYQSLSKWIGGLSVDGSQRETPLSASRIRQTHQCIGAILKYAQKSGLVAKNVAADVERKHDLPTENERTPHYLTHTQLLGLASHMERFETLTLVLGYCGTRLGEASALRRGNVKDCRLMVTESATNVTGKGMVTTKTKTGKSREVAVPAPVWDRLVTELPNEPNALVFPNRKGAMLTNHQYRYVLDKAVAAIQAETTAQRDQEIADGGKATTPEFPTITPHDLRHTCASLLISTGANIKVVQRQLGHATAAMTLDRYGHLYDTDLTRAADELGKVMEAAAVSLRYNLDKTKVRAS